MRWSSRRAGWRDGLWSGLSRPLDESLPRQEPLAWLLAQAFVWGLSSSCSGQGAPGRKTTAGCCFPSLEGQSRKCDCEAQTHPAVVTKEGKRLKNPSWQRNPRQSEIHFFVTNMGLGDLQSSHSLSSCGASKPGWSTRRLVVCALKVARNTKTSGDMLSLTLPEMWSALQPPKDHGASGCVKEGRNMVWNALKV